MKARVSHLHKKEKDWSKFASWTPEAGEFIIYDPDENFDYARLKVGDGIRTLKELDFFILTAVNAILDDHKYNTIIDSGRITLN